MIAGRPVGQVGILVADLEEALERYSAALGGGPWRCYTYGAGTIPELWYRGERARGSVRLALNAQTPQIELMEPFGGPSVYDGYGPGLHHLGVYVDSLRGEMEAMARAGYETIQWGAGYGLDGDGGFAYFDTVRDLGVILEAIELPKRRREPELVRP